MYEGFYGLTADPFRLSSDPRFCFNHHSYARAKAYVQYALYRAEGFVMVTGKPGTGKTTLVYDLLENLPTQHVVAGTLVSTQLEADDLLLMTGHAFGLDLPSTQKALVLQRLTEFMAQQHRQGKRTLLIIDEAQDLAASALEELRLLTNLQRNGEPLLQIALLGQEPLRDLVRRPEMEQVHQRLIASWRLEPLDPAETVGYVRHRLERAGWTGDPAFERGVLPIVHAFSGGVPRRINLICSRLLLKGFVDERHIVTPADTETVLRDLYQEDLALLEFEPGSPAAQAIESDEGVTKLLAEDGQEATWAEIDQGLYGAQVPGDGRAPQRANTTQPPRQPEEPEPGSEPTLVADAPVPAEASGQSEPAEPPEASRPAETTVTESPREKETRGKELPGSAPRIRAVPDSPPDPAPRLTGHDEERLERVVPIAPQRRQPVRERSTPNPLIIGLFLIWLVLIAALVLRWGLEEPPLAALQSWWGQPTTEQAARSGAEEPRVASDAGSTPQPASIATPQTAGSTEDPATGTDRPAGDALPPEAPEPDGTTTTAPETTLLTEQILFRLNSTTVDPPFAPALDAIAQGLEQNPGAYAEITGYTDPFGDPDYNLILSRQRAQAVANQMISRGIASDRLRIEGRGTREPAPGDTASREEQRVVEVKVRGEGLR